MAEAASGQDRRLGRKSMSLMRFSVRLLAMIALVAASAASAEPLRGIKFGISSSSLGPAGPRIAKEMGLFAQHGLDPAFVVLDSASATISGLISRSFEVAIAGPTEIVAAQARGQKVVAIAVSYAGFGPSLVLSKAVVDKLGISPDAPVRERLKALDGLLIGSPSATSVATAAVRGSATAFGANPRFTYMAQPTMVAALESGAIQGYVASAPFWAFPVVKGSGVLWLSGPKNEFSPEVTPGITGQLGVLRDFAEANPAVIQNCVAALADFAKAIDERPDEVKAAIRKIFPDLDPKTLDLVFAMESLAWKGKKVTPAEMAHEIAVVKSMGVQIPGIDQIDTASMLFP